MKTITLMSISLLVAAFSVPAVAHDPHEHDKPGAMAADCSKMKEMDMSKMDSNDPVMKAMQKKCKEQMDHEHENMESATTSAKTDANKKSTSAPDCSKMKGMDMSKMDMKDTAMKAMHDKCMQQMKHDEMKPMTHDSQSSSTTSGK